MFLKALKYVFWLFVFAAALLLVNALFMLKRYGTFSSKFSALNAYAGHYDTREKVDGFLEKEKNSLDVVCFGSSLCHTNVNPNILWKEWGIASYDFCADQQDLDLTCRYVEEMFTRQKPRLLVVETSVLPFVKYGANSQLHFSLDPLPYGLPKIKAAFCRTEPNQIIEMLFPLVRYHSRWNDLSSADYDYFSSDKRNFLNGNFSVLGITPYDESFCADREVDESVELPQSAVDAILKIKSLADKNNAKVLYFFAPIAKAAQFDSIRFATIKVLKQYGLDYYDFNEHFADIQTDFATDYHDYVHMTYWGNVRFSKYFGKILKERYDIPDRRGDEKYKQNDIDCQTMFDMIKFLDEEYKKENGVYLNPKAYE